MKSTGFCLLYLYHFGNAELKRGKEDWKNHGGSFCLNKIVSKPPNTSAKEKAFSTGLLVWKSLSIDTSRVFWLFGWLDFYYLKCFSPSILDICWGFYYRHPLSPCYQFPINRRIPSLFFVTSRSYLCHFQPSSGHLVFSSVFIL